MDRFESFGKFLRAMRRLRGFDTQESMRRALHEQGVDITDNTFSKWEMDEVMPRRPHFQAVIGLLSLTEDELTEARRLFADAPEPVRGEAA